jgi:hypothetical protein
MFGKKIFTFLFFSLLVISLMHYFSPTALVQEEFKKEKKDNVIIVSNPKKPIPQNGLKKRIVFKEELSIGEIEGDENYMFGSFIMFNTDEEGNFYVSDFDNKRIQKYDAQGNYLLTIGRAGQGPGEFEFLSIPRLDKNNNVYVGDIRNKRVSFFNKNGKFIKQINIPLFFDYIMQNSKDFIVGEKRTFEREKNSRKSISEFGLFDEAFNSVQILQTVEIAISYVEKGDAIFSLTGEAFAPQLCYELTIKEIIYCGYPDKYQINIFSAEGKLISKIKRNIEPKAVSRKEKDDYINKIKSDSFSNFPEEVREEFVKKIKFPKYKPVYDKFTLMENGWLFVIVEYTKDKQAIVDLFDKEERYIAQFKTNVPTRNLFFKNGKAYAVAVEEGFPFVKRYAVELQEYKNKKWIKRKIRLY